MSALLRRGLGADAAEILAEEMVDTLHRQLGGSRAYFPRRSTDRSRLFKRIAELFDGRNVEEVCARLHIHRSTVYRALSKKR